jgi:Ser/Thr protein kinase RdoA (MazF antagonist)
LVPGAAVPYEPPGQRRRRGQDLARLQLALRGLADRLGQRPGWRPQHTATTVHRDLDVEGCLAAVADFDARVAEWVRQAAEELQRDLGRLGAHALPTTVVHGDFAPWNVHYEGGRLASVIDFGLTHLDSRPYELAIARTYRAPEAVEGYCDELARHGWPLDDLERAAIAPVYRAFRVDMAMWQLDHGRRTGVYDLAMIERQLVRTGTSQPRR